MIRLKVLKKSLFEAIDGVIYSDRPIIIISNYLIIRSGMGLISKTEETATKELIITQLEHFLEASYLRSDIEHLKSLGACLKIVITKLINKMETSMNDKGLRSIVKTHIHDNANTLAILIAEFGRIKSTIERDQPHLRKDLKKVEKTIERLLAEREILQKEICNEMLTNDNVDDIKDKLSKN